MARRNRKNDDEEPAVPTFPELTADPDSQEAQSTDTPAFPEMHNLSRDTAEPGPADDSEASAGALDDPDATSKDDPDAASKADELIACRCVRECFRDNELIRVGTVRRFREVPPHFEAL